MSINRQKMFKLLGEPDEVQATTKRLKVPCVYKYGDIEYHFTKDSDELVLIFNARKHKTLWKG